MDHQSIIRKEPINKQRMCRSIGLFTLLTLVPGVNLIF